MSSDDLTQNLNNSNTTQPTITAVFRFLQDMDARLNGRLDRVESRLEKLETRFDSLEARLVGDFAGIDARFAAVDARFDAIDARFDAMSEEMKNGFLHLSDKICDKIDRSRLHAEADYEDLLRRIRKLESKAS